MRFEIRGVKNGKAGAWKLEASNEESARRKAMGAGVEVQRVRELVETPSVETTAVAIAEAPAEEAPVEPEGDEGDDAAAPQETYDPSPQGIEYAPRPAPSRAPAYGAIIRGAAVLNLLSLPFLVLGGVCVVLACMAIWRASGQGDAIESLSLAGAGGLFLAAACMIAGGFLIRLLAAVALAIRDIARNTYAGR